MAWHWAWLSLKPSKMAALCLPLWQVELLLVGKWRKGGVSKVWQGLWVEAVGFGGGVEEKVRRFAGVKGLLFV
ncbi:hypothetical protein MNL08_07015 [Bartonella krasnovii]|uniref:hypothetical protein n=1 Tax=Bartonella krasnovii TaxID=2267275 RepID=UPI001F4CC9F1|nr:hypothetical protein [Bartonella krasnovii]UNF41908.1 hypothetical protein MNL08_07015 [Bartonella krasnovii]